MALDTHNSRSIPLLRQALDPFDIDWVWAVWSDKIGEAEIANSDWILPDGWEAVAYQQAAQVQVEDVMYEQANAVLVNNNEARKGKYEISNRIVLVDGRQFERSCYVWVREL